MIDPSLLLTFAAALFLAYLHLRRRRHSSLPLPPGPKPLPIVGNLFQMPKGHEAQVYEKWGRTYGSDILHVDLAGTSVVIINSAEIANELLERRSSIYSSRPPFIMVTELMGFEGFLSGIPYGETWRAIRRLFHREFHPKAALQFRPLEIEATHDLLRRLLDFHDDFSAHFAHLAGKVIIDIAYGIKVQPDNDPYVRTADLAMEALSEAGSPGAFYVESLPFLKYVPEWMPGAGFKRKAREWHMIADDMFNIPFDIAKANFMKGASVSNFTARCLEAVQGSDESDNSRQEYLIKATAGSMYSAGSETLISTLRTFILAMLYNPEVQKRAQEEIDAVVGHGNLPDFSHQPSLPYIDAIVKEVLRWAPVTPQSVPHVVTVEDTYNGYRIPAKSIVIPNTWAMLHDETVYPNPSAFLPERFLDAEGHIDPAVKDPACAAFGFGRRVCPGRYMAMSSLWITVVSVLAVFDVGKAVDEDGSCVEPSGEYTSGIVVAPLPFKASIKPRSEATKAAVLTRTG
ncbi:hypothetical protein PLICRDRAFT_179390 [Plicaturopsis crispa FD-325 SS-3]|uniref:Cytochrome P450 n=1 Tax=Plicaturopsis crispa FD-325 SS-3 TaxID=944288 RepID=A0A0C9T5F6_PLICR|nr:hypothetical protein PLICRDRAFT_179390 [Plicaturopsis crispa FD-325 SS-3]